MDKCRRKKKGSANDSAEVFSNISVLESRSSTSAASNQSEDEEQECLNFTSDASYSSIFHPTPMEVQRQTSISKFVATTTSNQKDKLGLQDARFFFSANIPFPVVENLELTNLLKKLRFGYELPKRNLLVSIMEANPILFLQLMLEAIQKQQNIAFRLLRMQSKLQNSMILAGTPN